jgi:hypothetical protein
MGEEVEFKDYIKTHKTATLWGKTIDITKIGTASADPNAGYALYASDPTEYMEVGHFINLVSTDTTAQGAGFVTNSNVAAWIGGNGGRDSTYDVPQTFYTVSEWRAKVQAAKYTYENAGNAVKSAKQALDAAKANLATAQSLAKQAQDAKTAASNAQTKYDQAVSAARAAATRLSSAKTALSQAQAKQSKADSTAKSARAEYERALTAHDAAAKASAAQANLPKLRQRASDAAAALRSAEARLGTAQSDLDAANKRLSAARAAWQRATAVQTMYRLYNPNSGEHFYTANARERDSVVRAGWNYEGVGWTAPVRSNTPVYRLYSGTDHHYTMSAGERDDLIKAGWSYEGIGWYSDDAKGVPLYRQFNPNVQPSAPRNNSGSHNYTTSKAENDHLVSVGWRAEGIGWYGVNPKAKPAEPVAPKPGATRKGFYAVRYDANGGAGYMKATVAEVGKNAQVSSHAFTRAGYKFQGWSAQAGSKVASYADGDAATGISAKDGGVVPLYAVWKYVGMPPTAAQLAQLKQAADDARAQANQAAAELVAAQKAEAAAQADANSKSAAATSAKSALDKANKAASDAQKASDANKVSDAQAKADAAQRAYDQAVADASSAMTAEEFINQYIDYDAFETKANANDGKKTDRSSLSYDRLLDGCSVMEEVNAERVKAGVKELLVSPTSVAYELREADVNDSSENTPGHSDWTSDPNSSRCLAWGYAASGEWGATQGWMSEKETWDEAYAFAKAQGKDDATAKAFANSTYTGLGENVEAAGIATHPAYDMTGHYQNLVDPYTKNQGAAYTDNACAAWGGNGSLNGDEMTAAEWRAKVQDAKDAYDGADSKVASAKQALDDAEANLATAQGLEKKASDAASAATAAQAKYARAKAVAQTAQTKYQDALEAYKAAQ